MGDNHLRLTGNTIRSTKAPAATIAQSPAVMKLETNLFDVKIVGDGVSKDVITANHSTITFGNYSSVNGATTSDAFTMRVSNIDAGTVVISNVKVNEVASLDVSGAYNSRLVLDAAGRAKYTLGSDNTLEWGVGASESAELARQGDIFGVVDGLDLEITRAMSAEAALQGSIDAETERAGSAEAALQGSIDAETERAGSAP